MAHRIESYGLPEQDCERLIKGVALGEYSLLLGAGFSSGATNSFGRELPTSEGLAKELKAEFSLPLEVASAADLPVAYEDAIYKAGDEAVSRFLRRRLTGCIPKWQSKLSSIEWWRVWTLNIDDLLAAVFKDRSIRELDFRDAYRIRNTQEELQIIYLHGRAIKPGGKIFSIQEYHDALRGEGFWHTAFFTEFKERPIIACGASLVGEFDLARTLRAKNESKVTRDAPSIAVVKGVSTAGAERLRDRLGLFPIDAGGDEFFDALVADVSDYVKANPDLLPASVNPNAARKFGQQFMPLQVDSIGRAPPRQDFYAGDEPLWADIVTGKDAPLSFSREAVTSLRDGVHGGVALVGIFGDAGSGKTATLLRVAREVSPLPAYLFRGEDDVDVDACLACVAGRPGVLFFDDAADVSVGIGDLAKKACDRGLKLGIVFAERSKRKKGMVPSFALLENSLYIDHSQLTSSDAIAVVERRRAAKRLGAFGSSSTSELRKLIINKHHGSLLSALAEIDIGNGFDSRLSELSAAIDSTERIRELVFAVAQTHRWGYPLPLHFATAASGVSSEIIIKYCSDSGLLSDILFVERRGVRFRHRVLAERVFERTREYGLMASVAKAMVVAMSPVVNPEAIRAKSYAHRICKVLMERRSVYATLGGDVDKARQWYADIEPFFGWNSRFWEQRALLELEAHSYSAAYSFARAAVDKENHAFPLTTFGTTCMIIAGHKSASSITEAFDLYCEGEAALQKALSFGRSQPETLMKPVATFFTHAERLWPIFQGRSDMRERILDNWRTWMVNAEGVGYFRVLPELESELRGWLLRTAIRAKS